MSDSLRNEPLKIIILLSKLALLDYVDNPCNLFLCLFAYNGHVLRSLICVNGSFSFIFRERESFS